MNLRPLSREKQRELSTVLKALYDAVLAEPVPQSFHDKIRGLK